MPTGIGYLERGLEVARNQDLPFFSLQMRVSLGYAYSLCDRLPEAEALLPQAVTDAAERGMTLNYSLFVSWLAQMHLYAHRIEDALREANRALDLARTQKEEGNQAWVLRLLGEIHSRLSPADIEEAERCYREALSQASRLQMHPLVAHCHLGIGRLSQKTGRGAEAQVEISKAAHMYRNMDMQFYFKQAEAELQAVL